jgi:signal transduction histidine kinase
LLRRSKYERPEREDTVPSFAARLVCWLLLTPVTAIVAQIERPDRVLMLHSFGPEFGDLHDPYLGKGIVSGPLISSEEQGREAMSVGARLLSGGHASDIGMPPIGLREPEYDWRELKRWHIRQSDLPPGSTVLFREPTTWERYRWQMLIVAAVIVPEAALIVRLLHGRRRRRRAEIEAHQRMAELAELNRRSTVGELSASITHDLTQPLSAISHNAEAAALILRTQSPDLSELRDIVAGITRDQQCATEVVKRLRNLLGKTAPEIKEIDLNEVVREMFEFLSATAAARHINLSTNLAAQALHVSCDRIQLQQVILNLVINAIDSTEGSENGRRKIIGRTAPKDNASAEVTIEDSGPGIPPDKAGQIFEPFFTSKAGGIGMGLSIARTIVESHSGRIWAENRRGGGATFGFSVPLAARELRGMPAYTGARQEESAGRESA